MIQLTGLWLNKDKNGKAYMVGYLGNAKVLIYRNDYKSEDKHPDYVLYVAPPPPKTDSDKTDEEQNDDIPF